MDTFNEDLNKALKYGVEPTHADFLQQMEQQPDEHTTSLVYADWLQEQGYEGAAQHIRHTLNSPKGWLATGHYFMPYPAYQETDEQLGEYEPLVEVMRMGNKPNSEYQIRLTAKCDKDTIRRTGYVRHYAPQEARQLLAAMGELPGAEMSRTYMENQEPKETNLPTMEPK